MVLWACVILDCFCTPLPFRVLSEVTAKAGTGGSSPVSMEIEGQREGSQTTAGGSPLSGSSSVVQQLQVTAPLNEEQLQALFITTQDFKVADTVT